MYKSYEQQASLNTHKLLREITIESGAGLSIALPQGPIDFLNALGERIPLSPLGLKKDEP